MLAAFADDLRRLRRAVGAPSYRALAGRANFSSSTLCTAANGGQLPSLAVTLAYVGACGGDSAAWEHRWREVAAKLATDGAARTVGGNTGATPAGPRELPADVPGFTGRDAELAELDGLIRRPGTRSSAIVIAAVSGTAGVGKTALAVHWAHRVGDLFPDGHLYVDLRGYDPELPMEPAEALARLLRALGVSGADVPHDLAERAARYRTVLAGRRVLVLLDNARSAEQVRMLLPGSSSCLVLVTSRDTLPGLVVRHGAHRINLDLLPGDDAVELMRTFVGERVDAELEGALDLVGWCARLPLALRIAAELAVSRSATPLKALADELADEDGRLSLLDDGADERTAMSAVFSWSYHHLSPDAAQMFRLLGLHPGPDIDMYATAALAGVDVGRAGALLGVLTRAHLLHQPTPGRFAMHDLLRAYAYQRAMEDGLSDEDAALIRSSHYYLGTAATAMDVLYPAERHRRPRVPTPRAPAPLGDAAAARAWLGAERANLVASTAYAASNGWPTQASYFALTLWRYLDMGAYYTDAVEVHSHALRAAREHGDRYGEGTALHNLGRIWWRWSRSDDALHHFRQALAIRRQVGDRVGEADTLSNIGNVYWRLGRNDEALDWYRRALVVHREVGDRAGQAVALGNVGVAQERLGRYTDALDHYGQALAIHREIGNRPGEGRSLDASGNVYWRLGRNDEALDHYRQALVIHRETGNRIWEASALDNLGNAYRQAGRYAEAVDHYQSALVMARELRSREGEAETLDNLGTVYRRLGRLAEALDHHQRSVTISREIGAVRLEARALNSIAETLRNMGRLGEALTHHTAALAPADASGDLDERARAHDGAASVLHLTGDITGAQEHWREALAIYVKLGLPDAERIRGFLDNSVH